MTTLERKRGQNYFFSRENGWDLPSATKNSSHPFFPLRLPALRALGLVFALTTTVMLPGCGGCRKDPLQAQKEKEKKEAEERIRKEKPKPKPDFQSRGLKTRPYGLESMERLYGAGQPYKPGHFTSTTLLEAKTNNFDFVGDLEIWPVDKRFKPVPLIATPFEWATAREVALPKGQPKFFESLLCVPPAQTDVTASFQLSARRAGRRLFEGNSLLARMPSYQYHFVVLARWPERYKYLEGMAAVKPPGSIFDGAKPLYRIALTTPGRRLELPSHALCWTSIAYVLWDDAEPDSLDPDQRQALLDWLHWGGQLILSGPDTLDTLKDSFLKPYLPAETAGVWELGHEELGELGKWSGRSARPLLPARPWTGVRLQPCRPGRFIPGTGQLFAERQVGRGRIVVSAFRLSGRELTSWPGWDSVLNSCVLGRPPREYTVDRDGDVCLEWADRKTHRLDAARLCGLRYFTRDSGVPFDSYAADVRAANLATSMSPDSEVPPATGVAAWNDFNKVAQQAREALLEAARVEIPKRSFVVWVLAGYLLILVPANWGLFRALGRVEWAWAAAPLIAVACTGLVIQLARLDIGFVRLRTELAVLELQADYPRAHVTRYTALYTSLSTGYDFTCQDPGGLVQPFPDVANPHLFHMPLGKSYGRLDYRRGEQAQLAGFSVASNSTGLIHSEHMLPLDGPLALVENPDGGHEFHNRSKLTLLGAGILKKDRSGEVETAWLGNLTPGAKVWLMWTPQPPLTSSGRLWQSERAASPMTAPAVNPGELNLRKLLEVAQDINDLQLGEVRLVAFLDREVPGLSITPASPQSRHGAVVIAHLRHEPAADPQPDKNSRSDVATHD